MIFGIFYLVFFIWTICNKSIQNKFWSIFCFSSFILLLDATKLILSVILFYFMEKGDLEKYDNFLDCKNVKVKFFTEISDINKLRGCFFAFVILNMISLGVERIEKALDFGEKIVDRINKMNAVNTMNIMNGKSMTNNNSNQMKDIVKNDNLQIIINNSELSVK